MRKVLAALFALAGAWILFIAVSNLREAHARDLQKRTMADMRTLAMTLEARATDTNSYDIGPLPQARNTARVESFERMQRVALVDLQRTLQPRYIRRLPIADGWGQPFDIRIGGYDDKGHATSYAIRSLGSDRRADGGSYVSGTITRYSQDLLYSDGNFFRYPDAT